MAHYDTKVDTPGATDNGSGAAALLALAEGLGRRDHALGLECIAFGDEEYYARTDVMYVAERGERMSEIVLALNMDLVGQRLGNHEVCLMGASPACREVVDGVLRAYPSVLWGEPWPESNHSTFSWRGVPTIAIKSRGTTRMYHEPADTLEWVGEARMDEVIELVARIAEAMQPHGPEWSRP